MDRAVRPKRLTAATPTRIAIVGAGVRGLVSAAYLRRRGHRVPVFEKADGVGGIWRRVYETSVADTPSHGYTFHPSNRWSGPVPTRDDVLGNLDRMVEVETLASSIRLSTPVDDVRRAVSGEWSLRSTVRKLGDAGPDLGVFDGVLVCTGFLGAQKLPPEDLVSTYGGDLLLPDAFDPAHLFGRDVTIVGSGSAALEMMQLALGRRVVCR